MRHELSSAFPSLGQLTSSVLFACEPLASPATGTATAIVTKTFTKVWQYTAWAACPTSEWPATYRIREVYTGDSDTWTRPNVPPNFIKTVITCGVCVEKTQTITCPVEEAARTGDVTIYGNGITATPASVLAQPTGSPDFSMGPGPGPGSSSDSMSGAMSGMGSGPGTNGGGSGIGLGALAPGAGPGSIPSPGAGAGGNPLAVVPVPTPNKTNGSAGPGSLPDSGSAHGPGAAPAPAGSVAGGPSPTMVISQSITGTNAASSPYVTAGAPSLKSALFPVLGVFAVMSGAIVHY